MMDRQILLDRISRERTYQEKRWGNTTDDTKNNPNDWVAYITHHSSRWFDGGFAPYNDATVSRFREQMVKVATLAIAAIESLDRQRATRGKAFYES